MEIRKRLFRHDKNRAKQTYQKDTPEFEVAEIAYECFLELTGVTYSAINRAYPRAEREKNPKAEYLWSSAHAQAKEFLTRYKNNVRDAVIPLANVTKHKVEYDDSQDRHTQEFKKLIIDNCFYMLYFKLKAFGPMMLPADQITAYEAVLDVTYQSVKEKIVANLAFFEAEGVLKEEDYEQNAYR